MNLNFPMLVLLVHLYSLIKVLAAKPETDTNMIYLKQNIGLISGPKLEAEDRIIFISFMKMRLHETWIYAS